MTIVIIKACQNSQFQENRIPIFGIEFLKTIRNVYIFTYLPVKNLTKHRH